MSEIFDKAKSRVLDRIESPRDLVEFKLGAALKMENTVLRMLKELQDEAHSGELKQQFATMPTRRAVRSRISSGRSARLAPSPTRSPAP